MKKTFKWFVVIAFIAAIGISMMACPDPDLEFAGTISISPAGPFTLDNVPELTATYSGTETVTLQWKRNNENINTAPATNPGKFTPTETGSYTVTVSAAGFQSKTSNTVVVNPAPIKTVAVGAQSGTLTAGKAGIVTFPVTTANIANGSYTPSADNLPGGVTISGQVTIADNSGTLTLSGNTTTTANTYSTLTLTLDGATSAVFTLLIIPAPPEPTLIRTISAGGAFSLALDTDGDLWAWGANASGQLGDATTTSRNSPVRIKQGTKFQQIATGSAHSLAIDAAGDLWTWGRNADGQLGDGTTTNRTSPIQIKSGTKFIFVAAGNDNSFAIDEDGGLWAWGANGTGGRLGNGSTTAQNTPVAIQSDTEFVYVAASNTHTLAIDKDGDLWAWGGNNNGQHGNGTSGVRTTPVKIELTTKFEYVIAGNAHSHGIDTDGDLWAWGNPANGRLGNGSTTGNVTAPAKIKDGTEFIHISAFGTSNTNHVLAVAEDGSLWAWGGNGSGRLGDGTTVQKETPVAIKPETKFVSVSAGEEFSFGLDEDGGLWAWGNNSVNQLGDGTSTARHTPVSVTFPTK